MSCKQQLALTEAWSSANDELSTAIRAMTGDSIGKMSKADYMALRATAENARLKSENARTMLDLHRKEHGC
jgi:hypothetical protein